VPVAIELGVDLVVVLAFLVCFGLLWAFRGTLKPLLTPHPCIESAHPSPLSAHNGFFGSKPFSRANAMLAEQGAEPIDWRLP